MGHVPHTGDVSNFSKYPYLGSRRNLEETWNIQKNLHSGNEEEVLEEIRWIEVYTIQPYKATNDDSFKSKDSSELDA